MATTPEADEEARTIASHTLTYLRSLDRKVDPLLEAFQRQGERVARIEHGLGEIRRGLGDIRRNVVTLKSDIALPANKMLAAHAEILKVLRRLDSGAGRAKAEG